MILVSYKRHQSAKGHIAYKKVTYKADDEGKNKIIHAGISIIF